MPTFWVWTGRGGAGHRPVQMENKGVLIAVFAAPVAAAALMWAAFSSGLAEIEPRSVLRLEMPPSSGRVGLPKVEGPADASRPLVVIDAGHGGHDPGASGQDGEREKDLTLMLAQSMRDALLDSGRVRVALTRDTDRFLVLAERADIA